MKYRNIKAVIQAWAVSSAPSGRCGSVFFNDSRLYSYGAHFCLARRLPNGRAALNSKRYSVTTSKHLSWTRNALLKAGFTVLMSADPENESILP